MAGVPLDPQVAEWMGMDTAAEAAILAAVEPDAALLSA